MALLIFQNFEIRENWFRKFFENGKFAKINSAKINPFKVGCNKSWKMILGHNFTKTILDK